MRIWNALNRLSSSGQVEKNSGQNHKWLKGKKEDEQDDNKGNPILVMRCRDTKLTASRVVIKKGVDPYCWIVHDDKITLDAEVSSRA